MTLQRWTQTALALSGMALGPWAQAEPVIVELHLSKPAPMAYDIGHSVATALGKTPHQLIFVDHFRGIGTQERKAGEPVAFVQMERSDAERMFPQTGDLDLQAYADERQKGTPLGPFRQVEIRESLALAVRVPTSAHEYRGLINAPAHSQDNVFIEVPADRAHELKEPMALRARNLLRRFGPVSGLRALEEFEITPKPTASHKALLKEFGSGNFATVHSVVTLNFQGRSTLIAADRQLLRPRRWASPHAQSTAKQARDRKVALAPKTAAHSAHQRTH